MQIQNFKPFEDFLIKFDSPHLIVFDGPNGFGKTSFYDAIELFFTGKLRRYNELVSEAFDKRQSVNGSPLLNDRSRSGDLIIKGELDVDGKKVNLVRVGRRIDLKNAKSLDDFKLELYSMTQFDSVEFLPVEDESEYLTALLGKDYIENFEFLNYIEQEENIYFLKNKDKDRKELIAHLFNTSSFEERISKLTEASKKIVELCGSKAEESLKEQKTMLDEHQSKLTSVRESVPFSRLIKWKEVVWDSEKLDFPNEQYVEWLGKEGELAEIEFFLTNLDEFRKDWQNKKLDELIVDKKLAAQLLLCWNFIDNVEEFSSRLILKESIDNLLMAYEQGVHYAVTQGKATISQELQELIKPIIDVQAYATSIESILSLHKSANILSKLLISVKDSRKAFIEKIIQYETKIESGSSCPLCGYSWKDAEELHVNFDKQSDQLERLIEASGRELNLAVDNFSAGYVVPITRFLKVYLSDNPIDKLFVQKLREADKNRDKLNMLYKKFFEIKFDLKSLLNITPSSISDIKFDELQTNINEKKHRLDSERLRPYFELIFLRIFDENFENIASIDKSKVIAKRNYIEWQYSIYQSAFIKKLQKAYDKQKEQFDNAEIIKKKIDKLKKAYNDSLDQYQKNLIENIEILFHVYSGRITQEGQGSLGLFIESANNGIRFLENHSKKHDAVFTMSSGQLAALVIAFTLALNKRYSKNKLLFIDDPIQTLDELNIAGFIELLRHEFSDRQIFLSTHEDMKSAYIRYKFEKFGLQTNRLNFKEKLLAFN